MKYIWSMATKEEMISALWAIAALIAGLHPSFWVGKVVAITLGGLAVFGFIVALKCSHHEQQRIAACKQEEREKETNDTNGN